jgi:ankyrin repeat protein
MDVKRDSGYDGREEAVALQVDVGDVGDLAGLEGDEKAFGRVTVEKEEDATTPIPQEMKSEHESEESRAADFEVVGTVHPPPAPTQLHRHASIESSEQTRVDFQLHSPNSNAEGKQGNIHDGDEVHVVRSGEWASTRRSGKRMQTAPRAASGRSSAGLAGAKEAKDEASAGNQQRVGQQLTEEDNLLLLEVYDDNEGRIEPRRLAIQVELKDESTDAGMGFGLQEEVSIVNHEVGEPSKPLQLAELVEGSNVRSVSTIVAADAADADMDSHASHPSADLEPEVAATSSAGSIPQTLTAMDIEAEGLTQQETTWSANRTPSTIPDEQEWVPCVSDSGHTYYYNRFTQECRWQRPQTPEQRQEAFDAVVSLNRVKLFERLLVEGLDPNTTSNDGFTLLHMATQTGNERAAELLLSYGAAVESAMTITPLLTACQHGQPRIVKHLLENGASPERTDAAGNSAFHLAISPHNCEILRELLAAADDRLMNQQNAEGETVLHIAAKLDNAEAVQTLLDHGADPRIEDLQGQSPLIVAILENSVECAQLLQSVHASVDTVSDTQRALPAQTTTIFAASEESENDVDKLLASIVPAPESCDHEVLEALRSFADETQRAISTLEDQLQVGRLALFRRRRSGIDCFSCRVDPSGKEAEREELPRTDSVAVFELASG